MSKSLTVWAVVLLGAGLCRSQIKLTEGTTVLFGTVDEGRKILTARDDFIRGLSPFDRAARMKTDRDVSEKEFLEFVGANVLAWTDEEKERVAPLVNQVASRMARLALPFPTTVYLIKTSGNEEGRAAYTRANAVVLPVTMVGTSRGANADLVCHELFHVLSRSNPHLRERLYQVLGFKKCNEIAFPATLKPRKLTNPDAPANNHYIEVQVDGTPALAVPILFSRTQTYDVNRGGEFFQYLVFQFLLVAREGDSDDLKPLYDGVAPRLAGVNRVSGFWEQVGRNTQYIYHPEEILADNFALLVMQSRNATSPEILDKMREVLSATPPIEADTAGL